MGRRKDEGARRNGHHHNNRNDNACGNNVNIPLDKNINHINIINNINSTLSISKRCLY